MVGPCGSCGAEWDPAKGWRADECPWCEAPYPGEPAGQDAGPELVPPAESNVIIAAKRRRDSAPRMWSVFDGWVAATDSEKRWLLAVVQKEALDTLRDGV